MAWLIKVWGKPWVDKAIKIIVLGFIVSFVVLKVKDNEVAFGMVLKHLVVLGSEQPFFLCLIVFLMFVNWGVEAAKWKVLVKSISSITYMQAVKGVLSGMALSFVTPHGVGDYIGRTLTYKTASRESLVGATLVGRIAQMFPTLAMGTVGVIYFFNFRYVLLAVAVFFCSIVVGWIVLILVRDKLKTKIFAFAKPYIGVVLTYKRSVIITVLLMSICRYLVFLTQLLLLLNVFKAGVNLMTNAAGSAWMFLAKSIIPSFNFMSDLGVRETSALIFFERYHADLDAVVAASFTLWVINILMPTIIAAPLVLKLKIHRK